jgi:hypothetical protein
MGTHGKEVWVRWKELQDEGETRRSERYAGRGRSEEDKGKREEPKRLVRCNDLQRTWSTFGVGSRRNAPTPNVVLGCLACCTTKETRGRRGGCGANGGVGVTRVSGGCRDVADRGCLNEEGKKKGKERRGQKEKGEETVRTSATGRLRTANTDHPLVLKAWIAYIRSDFCQASVLRG